MFRATYSATAKQVLCLLSYVQIKYTGKDAAGCTDVHTHTLTPNGRLCLLDTQDIGKHKYLQIQNVRGESSCVQFQL